VEAWQLEWELGLESSDSNRKPKIGGADATYEKVKNLQHSLTQQLIQLVELCRNQRRLLGECGEFNRGGGKAWTWRKALVLPTRQIFFEDAGEALNFLAEDLEYEIKQRVRTVRSADTSRRRRWPETQLHLSLCGCGCKQFFLWEGNWKRKQRKFLNDKHRMDFHNRKNLQTGAARRAMRNWREAHPEHKLLPSERRSNSDGNV